MASSFQIAGFDKTDALLKSLGKGKVNAAIRKGTRVAAKMMRDILRDVTPVKTGAGRNAIKVRALARSRSRVGCTVRYERPPGADLLYLMVVNYGSKLRNITARHFISAAVKAHRAEIADLAMRNILEILHAT